ncbi:MAG: hypothetical protein U1U88_001023 [Lawsonella clevelandensis]
MATDPQEGKEKPGTVVFTFRNPPRDLPKQMQVGRVEAVTTRTNVAFVEGLQDAVAQYAAGRHVAAAGGYGDVCAVAPAAGVGEDLVDGVAGGGGDGCAGVGGASLAG